MTKETSKWRSERLQNQEVQVVRWGDYGTPVLLFPTAAGDAEECERFLMIKTLAKELEGQKIKLYSVDSIAGQAWLSGEGTPQHAAWVQNQFDSFVYHELVTAIRQDCRSKDIEIIAAGASIGAYNALAALCRHPDVFSKAICMSGTYDLKKKFMDGKGSADWYHSSPLDFIPDMKEGAHLAKLRQRFVLLAHGKGKWEAPEESWRVANVLGSREIPNRVDEWGSEWHHDWPTWRNMLPKYLDEFVTG
jgi:esterase/lipase superfamily enzyme